MTKMFTLHTDNNSSNPESRSQRANYALTENQIRAIHHTGASSDSLSSVTSRESDGMDVSGSGSPSELEMRDVTSSPSPQPENQRYLSSILDAYPGSDQDASLSIMPAPAGTAANMTEALIQLRQAGLLQGDAGQNNRRRITSSGNIGGHRNAFFTPDQEQASPVSENQATQKSGVPLILRDPIIPPGGVRF